MSLQTSGTLYGFYGYNSTNQDYYNNTVYGYSSGTTNYPAYLYSSSASNSTYTNNVFVNGGATGYAMYVYNPDYITSSYNLIYSTGSAGTVYKGTTTATAYATLALYRAAFPAAEIKSVSYPAVFTSATNLLPKATDSLSWAFNGLGIQIPGNNLDYNLNIIL